MQSHLFEALFGAAAAIALSFTASGLVQGATPVLAIADTVQIEALDLKFPAPGEFLLDGRPATSPVDAVRVRGFRVMKQQVGAADYALCVADGACAPAEGPQRGEADLPATGVSYLDAVAYAAWYSDRTGYPWRLPTAEEAAAAAGERFAGDAFSAAADDPANPAVAWLRRYREEVATRRPVDPVAKPRGFYGVNANGIEDFGGNVWEWTSTCHARTALTAGGATGATRTQNCGVRLLEGRHRAYMSTFLRDGRSGGCAVGTPPDHLGFRLVRDDAATARVSLLVGGLWRRIAGI